MARRIPTKDLIELHLDELKEQAEEQARSLGHRLHWRPIRWVVGGTGTFRRGGCTLCGTTVKISRESKIEWKVVGAVCPGER